MRDCPVCGTELPDLARFCSHCGEPQSISTPIDGAINDKNTPAPEAPLKSLSLPDYSSIPPPSIWPPHPPTTRWLIVGVIALVLIVGVVSAWAALLSPHSPGTGGIPGTGTNPSSNTAESPTVSTTSTSPLPISHGTVDLTFSGAVVGHITAARVVTCGSDQSVAGGMQYHVAVFGTISGEQYALTFGVYPYTSPNTYTSSAFSFFGPAGDNSSVAKWRSTPGPGANVTINSDGKSGTLDIGYLSSADKSAAHVSGSWKCA